MMFWKACWALGKALLRDEKCVFKLQRDSPTSGEVGNEVPAKRCHQKLITSLIMLLPLCVPVSHHRDLVSMLMMMGTGPAGEYPCSPDNYWCLTGTWDWQDLTAHCLQLLAITRSHSPYPFFINFIKSYLNSRWVFALAVPMEAVSGPGSYDSE